jgi:hypothetical protein
MDLRRSPFRAEKAVATFERWGWADGDLPQLARLACRFHQDFDLEELSVEEAIESHLRLTTLSEQEALRREAALVLARIPSDGEFEEFFVAAGAENWPNGERPRAVLERWLSELP